MPYIVAWALVAGILLGACCFIIGASSNEGEEHDEEFAMAVLCSLFWPVLVIVLVLGSPFAGLYSLGEWSRRRKKGGGQ